jgi:phage/plasmid-like protein (TIGR03299 family)
MDQTNSVVIDSAPETREERMRLAGHDWTIEQEPIFDGDMNEIPGRKLLRRSDTRHIIEVANDGYGVFPNETGHELFEALSKGAVMDDGTGGTIKDGSFCYLSARLDEPVQIKGDSSLIFPIVVVSWSHGWQAGSVPHSVQARTTNVRPVCQNTVTAGELFAEKAGTNYTFRHTAKVMQRVEEAMKVIRGAREDNGRFVELANELADISITDAQREEFVTTFIPAPATETVLSDRVLDNLSNARDQLRAIFDSPTIDGVHRNSGYGLMTAAVEWLDHERKYRSHATYLTRTLLKDEPFKMRLVPLIREIANA